MLRSETIRPKRTRACRLILLQVALVLLVAASAGADSVPVSASDAKADPVASPCPDGTAERVARVIQARYEGIRDIHARFEQTNRSSSFEGQPLMTPEPKFGDVVFAKPGKMRWSYVSPEPSIVVSNGRVLWIYDIEGKAITRLEVTAGFLSGAALQFLLGDGQILETFEVSAVSCEGDRVRLDLLPRNDATYERLGLLADGTSGDVVGTSVLDLFGNLTEIGFSEIDVNRDPAPETFELEIPDGVEVIDYARSPEG